MAKPDYPEILNTPIIISGDTPGEGLVQIVEKLLVLKEYYGVDWDVLAIRLAMDNLKGFEIRTPTKLGRKPKTETIARDIRLFVEMAKGVDANSKDVTELSVAYGVYQRHPDLGNSADAVLQRWKILKRHSNEGKRMREMIRRLNHPMELSG